MSPAWVALGANLGDPRQTLRRALCWLSALPHTVLLQASSLHRTTPVGPAQPDYLNAVARLSTCLSPRELLSALQSLERAAGRERTVRWGPRTLDLDLLMVGLAGRAGFLRSDAADLELPHPRMVSRPFVLAPLLQLDPDLVLPSGLTVRAQLTALS